MKKCPYSEQREIIVAEAINVVATELRMLDPGDLISLLRFECYGSIADLVSSAAELFYHPGTINFGAGGDYVLDWEGSPTITLDMEIKPQGVIVYAQLILAARYASVEINHISFVDPSICPDENTEFLRASLNAAKFVVAHQNRAA